MTLQSASTLNFLDTSITSKFELRSIWNPGSIIAIGVGLGPEIYIITALQLLSFVQVGLANNGLRLLFEEKGEEVSDSVESVAVRLQIRLF